MLNFRAKVINSLGEVIEVELSGESIGKIRDDLSSDGYTVLSINKFSTHTSKLKHKEILDFTGTLSILIESNLSLKDALNTALEGRKDGRVKKLLRELSHGLSRGESFSDIISLPKWGFSSLYIGLIRVGEKTGNLKTVLKELSGYLDREKKLREKITGAMVYPVFILFISILFSLLFIFVVLPQFKEMFSSFGSDISTLLNERAMSFTIFIFSFLLLLLGTGIGYLNQIRLRKTDINRASIADKLLLKLPKIKTIILNRETLNFLFALKVLSTSKLQIEESLKFSKDVLKNAFLKLEVDSITSSIEKGSKLSKAFRESYFPEKVAAFIQVGEETGNITEILDNLSGYYLSENNKLLDMVTALIDPLFTLLIGTFILVLIVMFILPLLTQLGGLF